MRGWRGSGVRRRRRRGVRGRRSRRAGGRKISPIFRKLRNTRGCWRRL